MAFPSRPEWDANTPGPVTALRTSATARTDHPPDDTRTVRLASPSLRGVVRFVLIFVACGIALYLAWRVRGVIRLVAISVFFALTLMPIVDAACNKTRVPRALVILVVLRASHRGGRARRLRGRPQPGQGGRTAIAQRAPLRG